MRARCGRPPDPIAHLGDRDRFREIAESELLGLHEGNYARYGVSPGEFDAWREVWDSNK